LCYYHNYYYCYYQAKLTKEQKRFYKKISTFVKKVLQTYLHMKKIASQVCWVWGEKRMVVVVVVVMSHWFN